MKRIGLSAVILATTSAIFSAVYPYYKSHDGKFHNGYISPEGKFYGCGLLDHIKQAFDLASSLGYPGIDSMAFLDRLGWVKVTMDGFFWDRHPNGSQKEAIVRYLLERGIAQARFNDLHHTKFLWKAQMDGTL